MDFGSGRRWCCRSPKSQFKEIAPREAIFHGKVPFFRRYTTIHASKSTRHHFWVDRRQLRNFRGDFTSLTRKSKLTETEPFCQIFQNSRILAQGGGGAADPRNHTSKKSRHERQFFADWCRVFDVIRQFTHQRALNTIFGSIVDSCAISVAILLH